MTINGIANIVLFLVIGRIVWLYVVERSYTTDKYTYIAGLIALILVIFIPEKELIEWMNVVEIIPILPMK